MIDDNRLDYAMTLFIVISRCDEASVTGQVDYFIRGVTTLYRKLTPYLDDILKEEWDSVQDVDDNLVRWQRRYGSLMTLMDRYGLLLDKREMDELK